MAQTYIFYFTLLILLSSSCQDKEERQFTLDSQVLELEVFAPGHISTPMYERDIAIHPDGKQLSYTMSSYDQKRRALIILNLENEKWSAPEILSFSGLYQDIEPFFSPDGRQLFFASDRPMDDDDSRKDYNLWMSHWDNDQWSEPSPLDTIINTRGDEFYPSVAANGNLYFTATRPDGIGREDIFRSTWNGTTYDQPIVLDSSINTSVYEFNAYIDPQEKLLIFSSFGRSDGLGGGDLYYSKKNSEGQWQAAVHMDAPINSKGLDYCPFIDWNNNKFYFTSNREGTSNGLESYDAFINYNSNPKNGMGDIYRIALDKVL